MAARVIRTVVDRHDTDPEAIDDVILGCSDDIGSQAGDIAWTAAPASLLHELERAGGRHGLQAMCEGGGQVNVTLIERR
jgi:acetyl-CoA acetyltransferase